MHSVRLDPFSAKLLAIRTRVKSDSKPSCYDHPHHGEHTDDMHAFVASTANCCVDDTDTDDDDDDGGVDGHNDYDGGHVATATSMLPVLERTVAFTGCDTCDKHAGEGLPTMAELMAEISDLKARMHKIEKWVDDAESG